MKNDKLLLVATLIMVFMAGVMFYQNRVMEKYKHQLELSDTIIKHDTIYQTLTFTDTITKVKKEKVYKTDTLYTNTGDSVKIDLKQKEYNNTIINDNDTLTYNAFVTGRSLDDEPYPTLDSINIKYNKQVINTTTIIEKPIIPKRKLKLILTPTITGGYDIYNHQWGAMVGIGIGVTKK